MPKSTPLTIAQELAAQGLQVLPAAYKDKAPIVPWTKFQERRTDGLLAQWFGSQDRNYWILTGHMSGVVVLDCDNEEAERYWREEKGLGDELDRTACVKTRQGHHYYFRCGDERISSWSMHPTKEQPELPSFDVRAEKTGVIAPPSVHESGHVYEWVRPLADAVEVPDALRRGQEAAGVSQGEAGAASGSEGPSVVRSMLSTLLSNPPGREGDGRNVWLSKVAGHYAKQYRGQRDAYETQCKIAHDLIPKGLGEAEYRKTIESIWNKEHEEHQERELDEDTGWLASGQDVILTQVRVKSADGKSYEYTLAPWSDFDIQARGVIEDESDNVLFDVVLVRKRQKDRVEAVLPARMLGDSKKLAGWLAGYGVAVMPPDNLYPMAGTVGARLLRYLNSQEAPRARMAAALGWNEETEGFLTFDEVIRADGPHPHEGVRPDPLLKISKRAPFKYGFEGGEEAAREVLKEVLTFHDETTASIFGAWWAACLLKPQIEARTALFPFAAIEAASESGKTTGFFSLMMGLNGNIQGETQGTKASSRDTMGSHKSGIVWTDDLDDPQFLHELLRTATAGGSMMKKGQDNTQNVVIQLVSPIVISGESLGLSGQKALLDRAVMIKAPSPVGRVSKKDPARPQWDDIVELRERYPAARGGLAVVAGSLVSMALREVGQIAGALRACKRGQGRAADKAAVLGAGARLLDALCGHDGAWDGQGEHYQRVLAWQEEQDPLTHKPWDNTLTLTILPWALRSTGWQTDYKMFPPVFVEQDTPEEGGETLDLEGAVIWFSPSLLAEAWERHKFGRIEKRTETETALRDQAKAAGLGGTREGGRKQFRTRHGGRQMYWQAEGEIAAAVLSRSRGE